MKIEEIVEMRYESPVYTGTLRKSPEEGIERTDPRDTGAIGAWCNRHYVIFFSEGNERRFLVDQMGIAIITEELGREGKYRVGVTIRVPKGEELPQSLIETLYNEVYWEC